MAEVLCESAEERVADRLAAAEGLAFVVGTAVADGSRVVVAEGKLVADGDKDGSEELDVDDEGEAEAEKELRAALCVPAGELEGARDNEVGGLAAGGVDPFEADHSRVLEGADPMNSHGHAARRRHRDRLQA